MASTTALFTGLSGLISNSRRLDVIGNNISNVNTTAFKSNRMLFATQFSRNISLGSVPSAESGGSNPAQIGLGVTIAGTQRDFSNGSLAATGDARDLAIEGDGFFVVQRGSQQFYTRAGTFRQNATNDLVTISGERVMGYPIDEQFNVRPGQLVPLNIPVGQMRLAQATSEVRFTGNLRANGTVANSGSVSESIALASTAAGNPAIVGTDLLTSLNQPGATGAVPILSVGQFIEIQGAEKGGRTLPTARFEITATSTFDDLSAFLTQAIGIDTSTGANPDGGVPGVAIVGGRLTITGNVGTANSINIETSDFRILDSAGNPVAVPSPINFSRATSGGLPREASGESVRTSYVAYDSLGTPVSVDITMVLIDRDSSGTRWRYFVESPDDTDVDLRAGTGTLSFDSNGQPVIAEPFQISIDRQNTGAVTPLTMQLFFTSPTATVTAFSQTSDLAATFQDGIPVGSLTSFSVGNNGIITGSFSNGLVRTVGQVVVAVFANPEGLVDDGGNLFSTGPNSGTPLVTTPGSLGAGRLVGGSLELSNVDLAREFIDLIQTSTGYSASSRVISTTDELLQQLLVLGR